MAHVVGAGLTRPGKHRVRAFELMQVALEKALADSRLSLFQVNGLIAIPSLAEPRFMEAHFLATQIGLLPDRHKYIKTIDTGGAGPVSGLIEAVRLIQHGLSDVVAVVAGDAVSSMTTEKFLERADQGCQDSQGSIPSPVIPHGYDRIARWQMETYGLSREQLAMCSVLMSAQACKHPLALTKHAHSLEEVLSQPLVAPVTGRLECARRADGGAAVILASEDFVKSQGYKRECPKVVGAGEASGPLFPPRVIDETMFSCEEATQTAFSKAKLSSSDIDFFGLYDCFPICLIRAIEAVGLAGKGEGGKWIEERHAEYLATGSIDLKSFPINTHGGLLAFGAPWEVPAMYNVIEAVTQLRHEAFNRQIPNCSRALVYGNGGIFSASSVAILSRSDS
jgi:acetyl-CoA acetyltransferase